MAPIKRSHVFALFVAAAVTGLLIFGFLGWRVTTVERITLDEALRRFAAVRTGRGGSPILELTTDGTVARRGAPPNGTSPGRLARLQVLVYHARSERLVESRIPFWFYRMKAPAAQFALEGTGVDLERLGVTASELERYGPRLVLDHRGSTGDHVLVWTE